MSAADGSLGPVSESANGKPANADVGALNVAVGVAFVTFTVADDTVEAAADRSRCTRIVRLVGPSSAAAEKVTLWPGVSKEPLLSRSQA